MTDEIQMLKQDMSDIKAQLALLLNTLSNNTAAPAPDMLYKDWILKWLDTYKKQRQSFRTQRDNLRKIERYVFPELGDKMLRTINGLDIQYVLNKLPVSNNKNKISGIIKASLEKAYHLQLIPFNPFNAVEFERHKSENYPVLQPALQNRLFRQIKNPEYLRLYVFCCCTGMRIGEALSLRGSDFDFRKNEIHIPLCDSSTKKHDRSVPFLPELIELTGTGKVFPMSHNAVRLYFSRLFERLKVDAVIHSFRHTFISCCYYVKIPDKYIQTWAGHSSIAMTMDTYTHIITGTDTPIIEYLRKLKKALKL